MDYKKLLDKYSSSKLFDVVLNLVLIIHKVRPAMLFESGSFNDAEIEEFQKIYKTVKKAEPSLDKQNDSYPFPRTLVYLKKSFVDKNLDEDANNIEDDSLLGKYLGFLCAGHDYSNYKVTRISVDYFINKTLYKAEVCDPRELSIETITQQAVIFNDSVNNVLRKFGYESEIKIKTIDGTLDRYKQLRENNLEYISTNLEQYISDFENHYISVEAVLKKSETYKHLKNLNPQCIKKLSEIYKIAIIDEKYSKSYERADTHPKILAVATKILKVDKDWWSRQNTLTGSGKNSQFPLQGPMMNEDNKLFFLELELDDFDDVCGKVTYIDEQFLKKNFTKISDKHTNETLYIFKYDGDKLNTAFEQGKIREELLPKGYNDVPMDNPDKTMEFSKMPQNVQDFIHNCYSDSSNEDYTKICSLKIDDSIKKYFSKTIQKGEYRLLRGLSWNTSDKFKQTIGSSHYKVNDYIYIDLKSISSWTTEFCEAKEFAYSRTHGDYGIILEYKTKEPSKLLVDFRSIDSNELSHINDFSEVVLMPGKYKFKIKALLYEGQLINSMTEWGNKPKRAN